jgi:hypothetical protein
MSTLKSALHGLLEVAIFLIVLAILGLIAWGLTSIFGPGGCDAYTGQCDPSYEEIPDSVDCAADQQC